MQPLQISDLFSKLFSVNQYGKLSTFYGVIATNVVSTIIILILYGAYFTLSVIFALLFGLATQSGGNEAFFWLGQIFSYFAQLILSILGTIFLVANFQAAVSFFNHEEFEATELVKKSFIFAFSKTGISLTCYLYLAFFFASFGYLLCIIPGALATTIAGVAYFTAVNQEIPYMQALSLTWEKCKDNLIPIAIYAVVISAISLVGTLLTCGIGSFVVIAFLSLANGTLYVTLFDIPFFEKQLPDPTPAETNPQNL